MSEGHHSHDLTHETVFDVDIERLARVYAKAVLNAAGDHKSQQAVVDELYRLHTEVLSKHPDLEKVFASALVTQDQKIDLLDRVFGSRVSTTVMSFLKVLAQHNRLGFLRHVIRVACQLWKERCDQVTVKLELAHKVDAALQQEIVATLAKTLGAEPLVSVTINPDLIAGFVARVGDRVYDASIRNSLERARQAMVARAVEAIQQSPQFYKQNA
jgi:F-type H+-transporting ATPase subunit delta